MTLYEFIEINGHSYDTYDCDYDAEITVEDCCEDDKDDYYRFCNELYKKVKICGKLFNEYSVQVNWSELIEKNLEKFKQFTKEHWITDYEDLDDFICEWIEEIHHYFCGNVSEEFYTTLYEFVKTLKPVTD